MYGKQVIYVQEEAGALSRRNPRPVRHNFAEVFRTLAFGSIPIRFSARGIAMQMKLFIRHGHDEIRRLEDEVNEWLTQSGVTVKHVEAAMCQIAENPQQGERYQSYVLTVWYEEEPVA